MDEIELPVGVSFSENQAWDLGKHTAIASCLMSQVLQIDIRSINPYLLFVRDVIKTLNQLPDINPKILAETKPFEAAHNHLASQDFELLLEKSKIPSRWRSIALMLFGYRRKIYEKPWNKFLKNLPGDESLSFDRTAYVWRESLLGLAPMPKEQNNLQDSTFAGLTVSYLPESANAETTVSKGSLGTSLQPTTSANPHLTSP